METEAPVKFGPVFAATAHVVFNVVSDPAHGACAVKLTENGLDAVIVCPRPCRLVVVHVRPDPFAGGEIIQPEGTVRLNELIWPLVGVRENVKSWVAPASVGGDNGVMLATALAGAASAEGAMRPASNRRMVRTNGVRQRGVPSFTMCLLTGRRTNAFAVPRPGDRRMAEEVSRR